MSTERVSVHDIIDHPSKVKDGADYLAFCDYLKSGGVVSDASRSADGAAVTAPADAQVADEGLTGYEVFLWRQNHAGAAPPARSASDAGRPERRPGEGENEGPAGEGVREPDAEATAAMSARELFLYRGSHGGQDPEPSRSGSSDSDARAMMIFRQNHAGRSQAEEEAFQRQQVIGERGR